MSNLSEIIDVGQLVTMSFSSPMSYQEIPVDFKSLKIAEFGLRVEAGALFNYIKLDG